MSVERHSPAKTLRASGNRPTKTVPAHASSSSAVAPRAPHRDTAESRRPMYSATGACVTPHHAIATVNSHQPCGLCLASKLPRKLKVCVMIE